MREHRIRLPIVILKEDNNFIVWSPALDLSSCGATVAEAERSFARAVALFAEELEEMGTFEQVLTELGWRQQAEAPHTWAPPFLIRTVSREVRVPLPA